jgi:hypothetical protein
VLRKIGAAVTPLLLVVGFVAVLAPQAASAAQKTAAPHLNVCAHNAAGVTSSFSVNGGKSFSLTGWKCSLRTVKIGLNKVVETRVSSGYKLKSISLTPKGVVNISTRTASVRLATGVKGLAAFANSKPVVRQTGSGWIELCKYAAYGNPWTAGDFTFTISGVAKPVTVLTGTCSAPIAVPAGPVTVTEDEPANFMLEGVITVPSTALTSVNKSTSSAVVTVPNGVNVVAAFYNEPQLGVVKVCKTLAANATALEGDTFYFDVSYTFTPPAPASPISGSGVVSVTAPMATGQTVCAPFFPLLPVGTSVTITEDMNLSPANISPTVTGIIPPSANNGSTSTVANLIVAPGGTDAFFTNGALGYIEVCKNPIQNYGQDTTAGAQPFYYSIDGGPTFSVTAGNCSAPMQVAVGTHSVYEYPDPNYYFVSVSTVAADDPTGARLLSSPTTNPASVSVPYGGIGNETVVTFTNHTPGAQIKVCVEQTSPDANLGGVIKNVTGMTSNGIAISASLTITPSSSNPQGEECGNLSVIFDAINGPSNSPVTFTLSETSPNAPAGTDTADVIYQGNGSGPSPDNFPQPLGVTYTFTAGAGENVVTFVNGRTGVSSTEAGLRVQ